MSLNVLSLFDGMSCGQVALERAGISVNTYLASEVDKYAIQIAKKNYPKTIHLGDVRFVASELINLPKIDLLMGGSPCQNLSLAGKRNGMSTSCKEEVYDLDHYLELKESGFEFEGQSYLFWEYVRVLKETQPKYFLLENVMMSKKWEHVINEALGVKPIIINSSLVSGQNRKRMYWTNIPVDSAPAYFEDIKLKDVLLDNPPITLRHTEKALNYMNRKVTDGRTHWDFAHHSDSKDDKSSAVVANFFKGVPYNVLIDQRFPHQVIRKFHPIECERLQTLPDDYTEGVSNTQRYKMIGNGWTVDVIGHILFQIWVSDRRVSWT